MLAKELEEYLSSNPNEIEKILEELGFGKILNRGRYISACVPNFNNASGFSILIENLYCKSFTTNFSFNGHLFDLVAHMKGYTNFGDTMRWCHKILGLKYEYNGKKEEPKEDKEAEGCSEEEIKKAYEVAEQKLASAGLTVADYVFDKVANEVTALFVTENAEKLASLSDKSTLQVADEILTAMAEKLG